MTKKIGIIGVTTIQFYTFKKTRRPLSEINTAIYGVPDDYFVKQYGAANAVLLFKNGHTQPLGRGEFLDPDYVKLQIDSMNSSHGKTFKLSNISLTKLMPVIIIIAVIASIAYTMFR